MPIGSTEQPAKHSNTLTRKLTRTATNTSAGTQFTCFTGTKVQVLTPGTHAATATRTATGFTGTKVLACFTGIEVQVLTQAPTQLQTHASPQTQTQTHTPTWQAQAQPQAAAGSMLEASALLSTCAKENITKFNLLTELNLPRA